MKRAVVALAVIGMFLLSSIVYADVEGTSPPEKVTHTSPSGTTTDATPTFTWNEDSASTWYRLWVGYPGDQKIFADWYDAANICSNGVCSVTLGSELESDDYEWYVKSWNDYGKVWSDGMSFSVQGNNTSPSKVTHTSPSGATQVSTPTFTWNADPSATWYKLWVGYPNDEKIFAQWYDVTNICSNGVCSVTLGSDLESGDYEWYVKSWNDYGKVWSDGMAFTVEGNIINQRNFVLTEQTYDSESDWAQIVQDNFGTEYRVADWNDLLAYNDNGGDLLVLYDILGLTDYGDSAFITKDSDATYSDARFYFASRHEGHLPTDYNYLAHENIGSYLLSLGSWHGKMHILAIKGENNSSNQQIITQNISAMNGGIIEFQDGTTLITPPGVLDSDTEIKVNKIKSTDEEGNFSETLILEPEGLVFNEPVKITIPTLSGLNPNLEITASLFSNEIEGVQTEYELSKMVPLEITEEDGTLSVEIEHFSILNFSGIKALYTVFAPANKNTANRYYKMGDIEYNLSTHLGTTGWVPGHARIYVGADLGHKSDTVHDIILSDSQKTEMKETVNQLDESNEDNFKSNTIIQSLFQGFARPGVVINDWVDFRNHRDQHTYLGAKRRRNISWEDRKNIVHFLIEEEGSPYNWVGNGTPIADEYSCVGLVESAYESVGQGLSFDVLNTVIPSRQIISSELEDINNIRVVDGVSVEFDIYGVLVGNGCIEAELVNSPSGVSASYTKDFRFTFETIGKSSIIPYEFEFKFTYIKIGGIWGTEEISEYRTLSILVEPSNTPILQTWYQDLDNDEYGNPGKTIEAVDQPIGYVSNNTDLDDTEPTIYPNSPEICDDGIDNDQNGSIDDGCNGNTIWYKDGDGDGYYDGTTIESVDRPGTVYFLSSELISREIDCNDYRISTNPGATEIRGDGIDNDCKDGDGAPLRTYYRDSDGDGYGDMHHTQKAAFQPPGYVEDSLDCNDFYSNIHPDSNDVCGDNIDNNCNNSVDEECSVSNDVDDYVDVTGTWEYEGRYGYCVQEAIGQFTIQNGMYQYNGQDWHNDCQATDGYSENGSLDYSNPETRIGFESAIQQVYDLYYGPNSFEIKIMNFTSTYIDMQFHDQRDGSVELMTLRRIGGSPANKTYYRDSDGDGYGDVTNIIVGAFQANGYVQDFSDCNDNDPTVNPGSNEVCNDNLDNNCNNSIDEGCSGDDNNGFTGSWLVLISGIPQTGFYSNITINSNGSLSFVNYINGAYDYSGLGTWSYDQTNQRFQATADNSSISSILSGTMDNFFVTGNYAGTPVTFQWIKQN